MKKIHNNFVMQEGEMLRILICYIFSNESLNLTRDIVIYCLQILNVANFFDNFDPEKCSKGFSSTLLDKSFILVRIFF